MKGGVISGQKFLIIFFWMMIGTACRDGNHQKNTSPAEPVIKDRVYHKPPASFQDTIKIHFPAAVFYNPDTLQLEKIKEALPVNQYENETHNCFFLMRNARMVLKKYWPRVLITETSKNRYLLFVKADESTVLIDLNQKADMCGIYLFDGYKDPELADMMNMDTSLGFYFSK